jgi:uncharacterized membrane protein
VQLAPQRTPADLVSRTPTARAQVAAATAAGVVVGAVVGAVGPREVGALAGLDAGMAVYTTQVWLRIWWLDARQTAALAERQDPTRAASDLLLLMAAIASLAAVGLVLANAGPGSPTLRIGLCLASAMVSWLLVHTVYTLRYARLYYTDDDGGINFGDTGAPTYADFAYLAFNIGMAFQVSDTPLVDRAIRAEALRHALLSYLFGTGILATTINLVVNLGGR